MPIDIEARIARNPGDPAMRTVLEKLQGNILRGHGRDHTRNLFVTFSATADEIRAELIPLLAAIATSALQQQVRDDKSGVQPDRGPFANFFLSAAGYRELGFSSAQIRDCLPEHPPVASVQANFRDGMREHWRQLGDPHPDDWEIGYRSKIHALFLLADDDAARLDDTEQRVAKCLAKVGKLQVIERGQALRNAAGQGFEHFGYADGRSQPIFFESQLASEGSTERWNPLEPLSLVLTPDRAGGDQDAFGSFYVFRKLEQNVREFHRREQVLADALGLTGHDRDRVGAMAVGRFRDGTPLVAAQRAHAATPLPNDFRFDNTRGRCPFHAHIRKVNPRGDLAANIARPETEVERNRRIVRRGIPYGQVPIPPWEDQPLDERPTAGVGLLFGCFQASIGRQFAFIQERWVNRTDFPDGDTGIDPILGTPKAGDQNRWNLGWGSTDSKTIEFGRFVSMKGGEFFFAPSMPFLSVLRPPA
ncbi:MAG TPA: hypothetical protein VGC79_05250 [Polyangiaceae bacterium]